MLTPHDPEFSRNLGFWSAEEQQGLIDKSVALAGVGGAGFPIGLALARAGVGEFFAADPDGIARPNINRHPGAFTSTLGRNKAEIFAEMVQDINPHAKVHVYKEGVTADNVEDFVDGADLVFDGIDFNSPGVGVLLHRQARAMDKPVLTGLEIGPCAVVTSYRPNGPTFEEMNGYSNTDSIAEIEEKAKNGVDLSAAVPYLPYTSTNIKVMEAVQKGAELPTTVFGVELFGAISGQEAFLHLVSDVERPENLSRLAKIGHKILGGALQGNGRREPVWAPNYIVFDMDRLKTCIVRPSKARFYRQAALLAVRSKLGINPEINYGNTPPVEEENIVNSIVV